MKRTVKLYSEKLNKGKLNEIRELALLRGRDKGFFLSEITTIDKLHILKSPRAYRDSLMGVAEQTGVEVSPNGLPARHWKQSLTDAVNTYRTYWATAFESVGHLIGHHPSFTKEQKRFCYWTMKDFDRVAALFRNPSSPVMPDHFEIGKDDAARAGRYLKRTLRRKLGERPRVRSFRSFTLDENMYSVLEHEGRLYLKIQGFQPRRRIVIPLKGKHKISGTIRVVMDEEKGRVEVHIGKEIKVKEHEGPTQVEAIDLGVSECFTDTSWKHYGAQTGDLVYSYSDAICDKGKKRNRLRGIHDKHMELYQELKGKNEKAARYHLRKALNIEKNNLGAKKLADTRRRYRANYARLFNQSMNELIREKNPSVLIVESLDIRGEAKSRRMSRAVSNWMRITARQRVPFKLEEAGCLFEWVSPAYSSQRCPDCGFVYRGNRKKDSFQCLFCGRAGDADGISAFNLLEHHALGLHRYLKKERVKAFLLADFTRRLESWDFDFEPSQVASWEPVRALAGSGELPKRLLARIEALATVSGKSPDVASPDAGRRGRDEEATSRTAKLVAVQAAALAGADLQ